MWNTHCIKKQNIFTFFGCHLWEISLKSIFGNLLKHLWWSFLRKKLTAFSRLVRLVLNTGLENYKNFKLFHFGMQTNLMACWPECNNKFQSFHIIVAIKLNSTCRTICILKLECCFLTYLGNKSKHNSLTLVLFLSKLCSNVKESSREHYSNSLIHFTKCFLSKSPGINGVFRG